MNNICPKYIKPVLSGAHLKAIAIITMIIDHLAVAFTTTDMPIRACLRGIGRNAFPIFCFLLVEGALNQQYKKVCFKTFCICACFRNTF